MEIRKGVVLDRGNDTLLGKTTLPKSDHRANHVLVFMVGGINSRWKQVIAYHYTGTYINGDELKKFVFDLIKLCADISLRVLCVTCDMGSSNRAMWRSLNLSSSRSSVTVCSVPHTCDDEIKEVQQEVEEPPGDDEIIEMEPLSRAESDIVAHLAGFLVKPLLSAVQSCRVCTQMLTAEEASEEHALVLMKEYVQGGKHLTYVSQEVFNLVSCCEGIFKAFSEEEDICLLKSPMKT
ncbi:hypothetical protein HPB47_000687, partial [Ixodes persulcatus]